MSFKMTSPVNDLIWLHNMRICANIFFGQALKVNEKDQRHLTTAKPLNGWVEGNSFFI